MKHWGKVFRTRANVIPPMIGESVRPLPVWVGGWYYYLSDGVRDGIGYREDDLVSLAPEEEAAWRLTGKLP